MEILTQEAKIGRQIVDTPHMWIQRSKSSDFGLISDFFPTPKTILEISVNLNRNFFFEGVGVRVFD